MDRILIAETELKLSESMESSIVAFKPKDSQLWFTGMFECMSAPNTKYNKWHYSISVILPIEPKWYEDSDKTVYFPWEIEKIVIL